MWKSDADNVIKAISQAAATQHCQACKIYKEHKFKNDSVLHQQNLLKENFKTYLRNLSLLCWQNQALLKYVGSKQILG